MKATIKKRKRVKHTRFPNGFGSVSWLGENRRRPYCARKTKGFNDKGHPIYMVIGYYETFEEAFVALSEYNKNPYDPIDKSITFGEAADRWFSEYKKFPPNGKEAAENTIIYYEGRLKNCEPLRDFQLKDLSVSAMQTFISEQKAGTQRHIITLCNQIFNWAVKNDIIERNPMKFVHTTAVKETKRNPFTPEEVRAIWDMEDSPIRTMALIMLYTGMRVGELYTVSEVHDNYFIAGEKTEAGINRMIPLHPKIRQFADTLRVPPVYANRTTITRVFNETFPGHTPHDCRRTFISRCVECGVDGTVSRKITGHAGKDIHESVYTFLKDPDFLCREVEKIEY